MVKVTPIEENEAAAFIEKQEEAVPAENDAEFTDTDSESSEEELDYEDDDDDIANETIADRIIALKDAVPPKYRYQLASAASTVSGLVTGGIAFGGKALWIITTSSLLLAVPLSLSIISEQQLVEMEREMKLTQSTNEVC